MSSGQPSPQNKVTAAELNKLNESIEQITAENEDTLKNMYLTFRLGKEDYGIEIRYVTEIVGMQKITEVPDMPGFVKGVVNLRGQVIPVLDMRLRFNMEPRAYDERTCIVVVNIGNSQVGLVVDTVNEVRNIDDEQISPPPKTGNAASAQYIQGMGKVGEDVIILLEGQRLLHENETAAFTIE
ncbi:MAG: chemotaxis protein CheW [Planctomycetaceae bacterium]|jgi:purine-binding chemotaxis protein CheW|nr:chemotaxis protein CheW [Planctomycetaceae bacterium]